MNIMNRCASVRKRGSTEQCDSKALHSHQLCGRHAKMKHPLIWVTLHIPKTPSITKVQAVVRGWLVRKRLLLAGPGVLKRKLAINDEDFVTCELKEKQYPYEYFAFEESGKIWWFDFTSLWKWVMRSHEPTNPYTRAQLTIETRKRIREVWNYRRRHRLPLPEESNIYEERLLHRWNILSQVFQDNGFIDVHPRSFMKFKKSDYLSMFFLLHRDLVGVLSEKDVQRDSILRLCLRPSVQSSQIYIQQAVYTLLLILSYHKDPYTVVFCTLSALYRC